MKNNIYTVSEYGYLHHKKWVEDDSTHCLVDDKTFEIIKNFILNNEELNQFIHIGSKKHYWEIIHLQNYVWVIQTKDKL